MEIVPKQDGRILKRLSHAVARCRTLSHAVARCRTLLLVVQDKLIDCSCISTTVCAFWHPFLTYQTPFQIPNFMELDVLHLLVV